MTEGQPTKAMILAAGLGTRLRPFTDDRPKCMMLLRNKPLLEYTIEWLRDFGVTDIMVNLCYLPQVIRGYFGDGRKWDVRISYSEEERPLGTAGGIKKAAWFFNNEPFFVWYGDNMSKCNVGKLYRFHRAKGGLATIALHRREDPSQSGIVGLDLNGRIVRFLEKPNPEQIFSNWVSAGIYVLEPEVLGCIPDQGSPDFGRDIFPAMLAAGKPLFGYPLSSSEGLWWIDTPEDLQQLQNRIEGESGAAQTVLKSGLR
jgi:NDP-sugar pyrophosphorylase family protein